MCSLIVIIMLAFFCALSLSLSLYLLSYFYTISFLLFCSLLILSIFDICLGLCPVTDIGLNIPFQCFLPVAEGWRVSARLIAPSQSLQLMALPGWRSFSCDSQIALPSLSVRCGLSMASFSEPGGRPLSLAVLRAFSSELRPCAGRACFAGRDRARSAERFSECRTLLAAGGWCGARRGPVLCPQWRNGHLARGRALLCRVCSLIERGERERRRASRPPEARGGSGTEEVPAIRPTGRDEARIKRTVL